MTLTLEVNLKIQHVMHIILSIHRAINKMHVCQLMICVMCFVCCDFSAWGTLKICVILY